MLFAVIAAVLMVALPAAAQTSDSPPIGRFEVDAGGGLLGGAHLGSRDADLRAPAAAPAR